MRGSKRSDNGQSLLEFALILPILALVLMGIIDFGQIFSTSLNIEQAARDAVRYASLGGTETQTRNLAQQEAGTDATVIITPAPNSPAAGTTSPLVTWTSGTQVTVQIQFGVQLFDPLMATILGNPYITNSSVTMMVE